MPRPSDAVYTVRSLEQARILADPLRVRLLREFVEEPRTTKQVAERLGENAPKLYRHVQALVDVGLLKRTGERKKRGTIERYLQAVAARFEVDQSLFAAPDRASSARAGSAAQNYAELVRTLFASAQSELLAQCEDPGGAEEPPTVARMLIRGSRTEVARIRRQIMAIVAKSESHSRKQSPKDEVELSGLIAFHVTSQTKPKQSGGEKRIQTPLRGRNAAK